MTQASPLNHGGNLETATRLYGNPAAGWIDLSTGINAVSYPSGPTEPDDWQRLPERAAQEQTVAAARSAYGVSAGFELVCAPGTQAILQWLPVLVPSRAVAVVSPTYGEHAYTWSNPATGSAPNVEAVASFDDAMAGGKFDTVVVVNPNNPDGRTVEPGRLVDAARVLLSRGGRLIVDEAFADVAPDLSVFSAQDAEDAAEGLIVLRSLGKMYGLAGARVGFAATGAALAQRLDRALGPWAVGGPSVAVAARALSDGRWLAESRERLRRDRAAMDALMTGRGLTVVGGTDLFRLIETPMADTLFDHLARAGIWVRRFSDRPEWLRFGFPGTSAHWSRLEDALKAWPES